MINIIIIEDKKDQLEDICNNLNDLLQEFKLMPKFRDARFKLIPVDTREESIEDEDDIEKHIDQLLNRLNPHILIIDYDLEWGESRFSFDGDEIVELVDKNINLNPFIVLASSQFAQKDHPAILVESGRIPIRAKVQLKKGSFMGEWPDNSPKKRDVSDILMEGIRYVDSLRLQFQVFSFPYKKDLIRTKNTDLEFMRNCRKEKKIIHTLWFRSDQIVAILLGERYTYSLILYSSTGNLIVFCTHFVGNLGKTILSKKYKFLNGDLGVLYNPFYMESVNKELRFDQRIIPVKSIKKFNSKINSAINTARLIEVEFEKREIEIKNIYPMYAPLIRFQGIT